MSSNPCVIVTGASSGIGRTTAIAMAAAGWNVALAARRREALEETAGLAKPQAKNGAELLVLPTDLSDPAATRALADQVAAKWGRLDALANVAGAAPYLTIEEITPEACRSCIDANLSYVVNLTSAAWPLLRKQGGGTIVNVSSMASIDPFPRLAIYAAAKAALNMFTRCTADEGKEIGVKAVALAIGAVETAMLRSIFDENAIPKSRTLAPEFVAGIIRDCITGTRKFTSGEALVLQAS